MTDPANIEAVFIEARRQPNGSWRIEAGERTDRPPALDIITTAETRIGRAIVQIANTVARRTR